MRNLLRLLPLYCSARNAAGSPRKTLFILLLMVTIPLARASAQCNIDTPALYSVFSSPYFCPTYYALYGISNYSSSLTYTWSPNTVIPYGSNQFYIMAVGNYTVTATDAQGCTGTSHLNITSPPGESTFGNGVWRVNAYYHGDAQDDGSTWHPQYYTGYYIDNSLNFSSENKWSETGNPSYASGYTGCPCNSDYFSWSAKRQGFTCGKYQIDVLKHDDEAQLWIDGVKVWDQLGYTTSPNLNVWTGYLNASSKVEFKVTDAVGGCNGALNFTLLSGTSFITVTGNPLVCTGQSYTLTSSAQGSYQWSNGETTNPAHALQSGSYSVTVTDANGCVLTSDPVSVTILSATAPVAHINASSTTACNWNTITLSSDSSTGNLWSTNQTTQSIPADGGKTYTLKVTNSTGCFDISSIDLAYKFSGPSPTASSNTPVCDGTAATLKASGLAPGGQVASFNGVDQYVYVNQDIPEYNFTIEMWVKTSSANAGIFSTYNGNDPLDRALYLVNGKLYVRIYSDQSWNTGFTISDGKWHHIALVVQTGVGQIVYVDGYSSGVGSIVDHSSYSWQSYFFMGYVYTNPDVLRLNGQLDNVRIWNVARSQTDIRNNMMLATPLSTSNLVYQCLFNGNTNATVGNAGFAILGLSYTSPDFFTYTWNGTGAPAPSVSESQTTSPLSSTGTYTVVAEAGCSSSQSSSTTVAVKTLSITADPSTICNGQSSQLNATFTNTGSASYSWAPSASPVANPFVTPSSTTTYTLTATTSGCTLTGTVTVSVPLAPGDTSVYGDHVWNVYAFNSGGDIDYGHSWNEAYVGYYADNSLNLNTQSNWPDWGSPSDAPGYLGCPVNSDNHSWMAKRRGFDCGRYQINIVNHDDEGQLFVNGIKVWEHLGCCDGHSNVWSGILDGTSTVVFRVTEGGGGSMGAIEFIQKPLITPLGTTSICPGYTLQLDGGSASSYLWNTSETTQTITVAISGNYSLSIPANGCSINDSIQINVAPLDTPELSSNFLCPNYNNVETSNYNPDLTYSWNSLAVSVNGNQNYFTNTGSYIFTATDPQGCSASSYIIIESPSNESDFGNKVWKVNAYFHGDGHDLGNSWRPQDYTGYYIDSTLNFDSWNKWSEGSNPSAASNYTGCNNGDDFMSWNAKRQGFDCGIYQIDVVRHDDEAQLFVDGVKVWDDLGYTNDPYINAWSGALNASSKVELRVTEAVGGSNGALSFTYLGATDTIFTVTGNPISCAGQSYTLSTINGSSILWSNGETTNSIQVTQTGIYSVTVADADGCSLTSQPVSLTILPNEAPVAHITSSSTSICDWSPVTLTSDSAVGNEWSTNETSQSIFVIAGKIYSLKVTNSVGCFDQASASLSNAFTPPAPVASNSGPGCPGSSVNLIANGLAPGGQVASLNGISQDIYVYQDIPENDFTIEMWVKTTASSGGIFSVGSYYYFDRALYLINGQLYVNMNNSQPWNTGFTINDGKWHHIALVVKTGVGQIVYVDGISSGIGDTYDHSDLYWQYSFSIGIAYSPNYEVLYFNGQLDNVRIWSEARTESDIRNNMMRATPASADNLIYQGLMDGNLNAAVGETGYSYYGVSFTTPDYFTYSWSGTGAPAPSTNETQTTSPLSADGVYTVSATPGCGTSQSDSTSVVMTTLNIVADPATVCAGQTSQLSAISNGTLTSYSWQPSGDTTASISVNPFAVTTYTLTAATSGCTLISTTTITMNSVGDTSVYGDHVWNVYAFNNGDEYDMGHSWNAYSGYYVDSTLNFNTESKWPVWGSPSDAVGYTGCLVNADHHSWSAKRKGFTCGTYQIDILNHDDEGQLFVNGIKVWDHVGYGDTHTNVWSGDLNDSSTVIFRVTEGVGGSLGAILITLKSTIIPLGPTTICPGYTLQMDGRLADTYLWNTGETTQSISISAAGNYSLTSSFNGCLREDSIQINVAQLDTPVLFSAFSEFCPNHFNDVKVTNYDPSLFYVWNSTDIYYAGNGISYVSVPGEYILTAVDVLGCSTSVHETFPGPHGDSDFGNHVWKVNDYNDGYTFDYGLSWLSKYYGGYYIDSALNFDSQNQWDSNDNPSMASNYQGCSCRSDYMSWIAKRQGFDCGTYKIDVVNHADQAQLYVDGIKVWEQTGASNTPYSNAWTGALNASSKVEFKVTNGYGPSYGALTFTSVASSSTFIKATGNLHVCTGQYYTLTSIQGQSYMWSNGETTNSIHASQSGSYSVTVTDADGCSLTSNPISVSILPNAAPVAHITASSTTICNWDPITLSSDSSTNNFWSGSNQEHTQTIHPTKPGILGLTVFNNVGCFDTASIFIQRSLLPSAPVANNSGPVCETSSVNLTATGLAPGGKVASLNGLTQFVGVSQDIPEYNFTVEMWVKTSAASGGLFSGFNQSTGQSDCSLYFTNGILYTHNWGFYSTINDNKWHHIAMVYQTGVGQSLYIDGDLLNRESSTDHVSVQQNYFRVGFAPDYPGYYFNGQIDNARIWSEARSQSDIQSSMMRATPLSSANLVWQGLLDGNVYAAAGNNGTTPFGISYTDADLYTYTWTGSGAPAPSTSETQTTSPLSSGGVYIVTAGTGGCSPVKSGSTSVTVTPIVDYFADADGDGYGSGSALISSCTNPGAGYVPNNSDCDDGNPAINPNATETCNNGVDDSCNGQTDENCITYTYYTDNDADTYGNPALSISSSSSTPPSGYVSNGDDCNDASAAIHPGTTDLCNSIDDNCNGVIDENALHATINPAGNISSCKGDPLTLTANSGSGIIYTWYKNGKFINGATTNTYTTKVKGSYYVYESNLICSSTSATTTVTVNPVPTATITHSGSLDLCGSGSVLLTANAGTGFTYQWMKGNAAITGATNQNYTATKKATYKVVVTSVEGCSKTSSGVKVTKNCRENLTEEELPVIKLNIYPNPSHDRFVIEMDLGSEEDTRADIQIFNSLGQQVYLNRTDVVGGKLQEEINSLSNLPAGNYFVRVIAGESIVTEKIVIQ